MYLMGSLLVIASLLPIGGVEVQSSRPSSQHDAVTAFEEGQNAQQRGDLDGAVRHYTRAISADTSLYQAFYQRATAYMGLGRESEALADLKKTLELQPDFARAHRAMGQILLDRGQTDESKRAFARALELDPKLTGVRLYYASALIKSGNPAAAIEHLQIAAVENRSSALVFALLGVARERLGKLEEALVDYSQAIEMEQTSAAAREGRARIFESRGDNVRAIEDYSIAYRVAPSRELALKLARLHARAGQSQAAIQVYRNLLLERSGDLAVRMEMAQVLAENGLNDEAAKEIEAVVAAKPGDPNLLMTAGDIYFEGKPDAAAEYYRRAVEAQPDNLRGHVQFGASLVRAMQFDSAVPILTEVINRDPKNYVAHANLATALFKLKRYPEAAGQFLWIIRARPEIAASYYFLAICFDKLGDCGQALQAYREFASKADSVSQHTELEEAKLRIGLFERLVKNGKCKSAKGKQK
jgi:tetratricopeptide (TPR) repeat protein